MLKQVQLFQVLLKFKSVLAELLIRLLNHQQQVAMVELLHLRQLQVLQFLQRVAVVVPPLHHLVEQEIQVQLVLMAEAELHGQIHFQTVQMVLEDIRVEMLGQMAALQILKQRAAVADQVLRAQMRLAVLAV
jgi:hypothetical protein